MLSFLICFSPLQHPTMLFLCVCCSLFICSCPLPLPTAGSNPRKASVLFLSDICFFLLACCFCCLYQLCFSLCCSLCCFCSFTAAARTLFPPGSLLKARVSEKLSEDCAGCCCWDSLSPPSPLLPWDPGDPTDLCWGMDTPFPPPTPPSNKHFRGPLH